MLACLRKRSFFSRVSLQKKTNLQWGFYRALKIRIKNNLKSSLKCKYILLYILIEHSIQHTVNTNKLIIF